MRLLALCSVLTMVIFTMAACSMTYPPHLFLFNEATDADEGEDALFEGRVVDATTGMAVADVSVRLELLRISGMGGEVFHAVGIVDTSKGTPFFYSSPVTNATDRCAPVDTLGSTGAYERINQIFREQNKETFIFERATVRTDSAGRFTIESTRRSYTTPFETTEHSFQRIVVEDDGYRLFSQGVLSTCRDHLEALRPVTLVPVDSTE